MRLDSQDQPGVLGPKSRFCDQNLTFIDRWEFDFSLRLSNEGENFEILRNGWIFVTKKQLLCPKM